jgi:hypothetical protein
MFLLVLSPLLYAMKNSRLEGIDSTYLREEGLETKST